MAHDKFPCEVLTPEGEAFNDEVEMVSTRTGVGSIGIRAHHIPLLAMLDPAELRLHTSDNEVTSFAQAEGYLQMVNNRCLVLVQEAYPTDQLDASDLKDRLQQAEQEMEQAEEDSERYRLAERNKKRLERFVEIAEGGGSS